MARVILGSKYYPPHQWQQIRSLGLNCPYIPGRFLVRWDLNLLITLQNGMCEVCPSLALEFTSESCDYTIFRLKLKSTFS